jgi:hypothetical protein
MNSGPIVAMVWEGKDAVKTGRSKLGTPSTRQTLIIFNSSPRCHQSPGLQPRYHPWRFRHCKLVPSETGTLANRLSRTLAAMSAMAPTASTAPRRRLDCGLLTRTSSSGPRLKIAGSTRSRPLLQAFQHCCRAPKVTLEGQLFRAGACGSN